MSPARRLLLSAAALAVAAVLVLALVGRLLGGGSSAATVTKVAQDRPGTVVLLPGYGGSTSALQTLADRLRSAGRQAVVVSLPGDGTDDLTSYIPVVDAAVRSALDAGAPSVDVVGYSAGGVLARLWEAAGGAAVTRRVVTLGAPHHGTVLARLGVRYLPEACPEACRQLAPGSALLATLNAGNETQAGPQWLSVWSTVDATVTPPDTARLQGATNLALQDLCPGARTSHSQLPRDARVQTVVLAALGAGPLALPTSCPA